MGKWQLQIKAWLGALGQLSFSFVIKTSPLDTDSLHQQRPRPNDHKENQQQNQETADGLTLGRRTVTGEDRRAAHSITKLLPEQSTSRDRVRYKEDYRSPQKTLHKFYEALKMLHCRVCFLAETVTRAQQTPNTRSAAITLHEGWRLQHLLVVGVVQPTLRSEGDFSLHLLQWS